MPVISVRVIKNPRKQRLCDECRQPLLGETIRLYGNGLEGDPMYALYLHRECISPHDQETQAKLAEVAAKVQKKGD